MGKEALFLTPDEKRKRGRPKITWRRTTAMELASVHLSWSGAQKEAQDRSNWKITVEAFCAYGVTRTDDDDIK